MEDARLYKQKGARKKLSYQKSMQNAPKEKWRGRLSIGDIDRIFDDVDSPIHVLPLTVQLSESDIEENDEAETPQAVKAKPAMSPKELFHPATRSPSPELNIGHVKTSSPLEENTGLTSAQAETNDKGEVLSPILGDCGGNTLTITLASDNQKESPTVSDKNSQKQASSRSAQEEPGTSTAEEDHVDVHRKSTEESVQLPVKKNIWAFLQKVRESSQPKSKLTPVKAPTPPPEVEEDFLILEDDEPILFSIPTKRTLKQQPQKESRSDKGALMDSCRDTEHSSKNLLKEPTARKKTPQREKKKEPKHRNTSSKKNPRKMADEQPQVAAGSSTDDQRVRPSTEVKTSSKARRKNPESSGPAAKVKRTKERRQEPSGEQRQAVELADFDSGKPNPAEDSPATTVEQNHQSPPSGSSPEWHEVLGKRRRNPPGKWWVGSPQNEEQPQVRNETPHVKKPKANRGEPPKAASASSSKAKDVLTTKKDVKNTARELKKKKALLKPSASELTSDLAEQPDHQEPEEEETTDPSRLFSPPVSNRRDHSRKSEHQLFQQVYQRAGKKTSIPPIQWTSTTFLEQPSFKRPRRPPSEWWKATVTPEEAAPDRVLHPSQERRKLDKKTKARLSRPPSKSDKRASQALPSRSTEDEERTRRANPIVDVSGRTLPVNRGAAQSHKVAVQVYAPDCASSSNGGTFTLEENRGSLRDDGTSPSQVILQSGPASMIELDAHDDSELPSTRLLHADLSVTDLCGPPLMPCTLRARDKHDLTEWLQHLFSTTLIREVNRNLAVSPDQFDWYCHKTGTMGIVEDVRLLNSSHGKMLLSSFMKKPLWVDHSATMVFFLLTSCVKLSVDCVESFVHAGNFFTVPCGHAYSIQNLAEQPAFLCFNRILTETPD
ncbi:serine/arginine repetitive matrix protein 1 isoform X3 [Syngnathus typhle]|uniref:serine/arginine repetitive matrix protein 1 isoform X3 n=1 Tax=Syngnathus typhle TaxID=161592 RepID=UPI002A69CD83|nr:serine/arginine repetitive matrix protein 1 isoform X3 [Syngnathus typhle]